MTYSPIQLDIIRTFGSKELSEGCKVKAEMFGRDEYFTCIGMRRITEGVGIYQYDKFEQDGVSIEILGHIPELFPDVARVAKEKGWLFSYQSEKLTFYGLPGPHFIPYNPTLPLIDQDESTLVQLLNLFK